jgi:preprotein translocase subunit SecA
MKPRIERLHKLQTNLVSKLVQEAETLLKENGESNEAGILLFRSYRGLPKHNKLSKILSEPGNKKLMQATELEFLREKGKNMYIIDEELYFVIDEKNHSIDLTEKEEKNLHAVPVWKRIILFFLILVQR